MLRKKFVLLPERVKEKNRRVKGDERTGKSLPMKRSAAAGARNFNISKGEVPGVGNNYAGVGRDKLPPGKPSSYGRQHMLSLSLIKFQQCRVPTCTSNPHGMQRPCCVIAPCTKDRNSVHGQGISRGVSREPGQLEGRIYYRSGRRYGLIFRDSRPP